MRRLLSDSSPSSPISLHALSLWRLAFLVYFLLPRPLEAELIQTIPPSRGTLEALQRDGYAPAWGSIKPQRVIRFAGGDGEALVKAVQSLVPGDRLEITAGRYEVKRLWDIQVRGTANAPIWIVAAENAKVLITRPDARQNVLNIGQGAPVEYLCLRGIELTGGGHGLRLGRCRHVWIDDCHIHHTGEVCLSANSHHTDHLYLTRNHLHDGGGHGEGMYLGANHGQYVMSESVVARNHVHDCRGDQGDGIEVKQGSWGNLIAENVVHDTQYPCITVYGTGGKPINIIERNLCYRSQNHVLQVQGEAMVRNNILIAAKDSGFASTDHQGKTRDLQVVHNTILNIGRAMSGSSWNGRSGMVVANNVLYSRDAEALHFANGAKDVVIAGNVVLGQAPHHGSSAGRGLADFQDVQWDGTKLDVRPTIEAPFEKADPRFLLQTDFSGQPRNRPVSGALTRQ